MSAAVAISKVHKHYGSVSALNGVDFSIARGEFFGLLGPNGAGKSTLINIIAGLARRAQPFDQQGEAGAVSLGDLV